MASNNYKNFGGYFVFFILMMISGLLLSSCTIPIIPDDNNLSENPIIDDSDELDEPNETINPNPVNPIQSDPELKNPEEPTPIKPAKPTHPEPQYLRAFYVSNNGDDSNDGLSPKTAWKTIKKVNSVKLKPGDAILFKRGDMWTDEQLLITSSGTAKNRIIYGAYGEGDKPIFSGIIDVPKFKVKESWTHLGNNVWSIPVSGSNYARVWIDGVEREKAQSDTAGKGITKDHPWQKLNYKLYIYSEGNPATTYKSIKITGGEFLASGSKSKDYITWNNLDIQGWERITLSGNSHWIIEHCNLGKYSSSYALNVLRDGKTLTTDGIIRYNTFDSAFPFFMVRPDEGLIATQTALYFRHGGQIDWDIHDNYFAGWGYTTFWFANHEKNGYMFEGIRVYNNYFTHEGLSYGRAFGGHHYTSQVNEDKPVEIFNNYFHDQTVQSQIGVPYIKIYNNIFDGATGKNGDGSAYVANALSISNYEGKPPYKTKIYNNIFANCGYAGMFWPVSDVPSRGVYEDYVDMEVVNNIFYNNGKNTGGRQFRISHYENRVDLINPRIDNNIFWSDNHKKVVSVQSKNLMDVATFNALDGSCRQNLNPSGNIQADPMFVDPENGDFRLREGSPAIGAGLPVGIIYDRDGVAYKKNPSIGPYEYVK